MKDYLTKMKFLSDILEAADHKMSRTNHILANLNGLSDDYESIVAIISSQEIPHSLKTFGTLVLSPESGFTRRLQLVFQQKCFRI